MHRRIIPYAFPGDSVPKATFSFPLQGELSSESETEEVELANAPLFEIVLKAASTSSAPAGHLAAKAEGLHRALQRGRLCLPFPATPCRWQRLRAFTERPYQSKR